MSLATKPDRGRWSALALIVTAQFMVVLDVAIVNVALPSIKSDLGFSQTSLQWVVSAYALLFGGTLLLGGRLADLLGRRRLFMAGLALFATSSLLCGLAWSEASLIAFRALQGLGGALLAPAALSLLMTRFAEGRERNLALGIYAAASGSGAAAGVLLGGVLTSYLSWSWIFFINVPVGAAAIVLTPVLLHESRAELRHRHFDVAGATSITAGLMLLVYAMTRATSDGWGSATTLLLLAAAVALVARVRRHRAALALAAPADADLPPANARGRERDDGDRQRGRVLGVLPADALPPGRPPLLRRADRRRLRRASRSRSSSPRTSRRRSSAGSACAERSRRASPRRCCRSRSSRACRCTGTTSGTSSRASCSAAPAWGSPSCRSRSPASRASSAPTPASRRASSTRAARSAARSASPRRARSSRARRPRTSTRTTRRSRPAGAGLDHGLQTGLYALTGLLIVGVLIAAALVRPAPAAAPAADVEDLVVLEDAA